MAEEVPDLCPEEERVVIAIAAESKSKEGDLFYLISHRWWQQWIEYVNPDQPCNNTNTAVSTTLKKKKPCKIDNSDLMINDSAGETLEEGRDYVLLPEDIWNQLHLWYGGGPILPLRVTRSGRRSEAELLVVLSHLRLQLLLTPKSSCPTSEKVVLTLEVTKSNLKNDTRTVSIEERLQLKWPLKPPTHPIILVNEAGSSWCALPTYKKSSQGRFMIHDGWRSFCEDNGVDVGDWCSFRRVHGMYCFQLVKRTKPQEEELDPCKQQEELVEQLAIEDVCQQQKQKIKDLEEQVAQLRIDKLSEMKKDIDRKKAELDREQAELDRKKAELPELQEHYNKEQEKMHLNLGC